MKPLKKLFGALDSGRCDAMFTDTSALAAWRGNSAKSVDFTLLPGVIAKSPFAGFVAANDSRWRNALRRVTYAVIQAEESGITSANAEEMKASADPGIAKFLGVEGTFGADFGIPVDFVARIIAQGRNSGAIYARTLGPATKLFVARKGTLNALAQDGGRMISPPWNWARPFDRGANRAPVARSFRPSGPRSACPIALHAPDTAQPAATDCPWFGPGCAALAGPCLARRLCRKGRGLQVRFSDSPGRVRDFPGHDPLSARALAARGCAVVGVMAGGDGAALGLVANARRPGSPRRPCHRGP